MLVVIGFIIACGRMSEDRERASMNRRPDCERTKICRRDRELTTPTRMGTDGSLVEVADRQVELLAGSLGERMGLRQFIGIEVDMRVKIGDLNHLPQVG